MVCSIDDIEQSLRTENRIIIDLTNEKRENYKKHMKTAFPNYPDDAYDFRFCFFTILILGLRFLFVVGYASPLNLS